MKKGDVYVRKTCSIVFGSGSSDDRREFTVDPGELVIILDVWMTDDGHERYRILATHGQTATIGKGTFRNDADVLWSFWRLVHTDDEGGTVEP